MEEEEEGGGAGEEGGGGGGGRRRGAHTHPLRKGTGMSKEGKSTFF